MKTDRKLVVAQGSHGLLSREEFQKLAEVPRRVEWFANIDNERTRRAYQIDVRDFMSFVGSGRRVDFPPQSQVNVTFKKAPKAIQKISSNLDLPLGPDESGK